MLKKIVTTILLGVAIILFTGCDRKKSREFIEGKAAELSKVYPTENLEDLFEKFPDGFEIDVTDTEKNNDDSPTIIYELILKGDPDTKEIKGEIIKKSSLKNLQGKIEKEILYQGEVYYKDRNFHLSEVSASQYNGELKQTSLLMQDFSISKSSLETLQVVQKGYSFETGSASIAYNIVNEQVNQYLGLKKDDQVNMIINIFETTISGNSYGYSVIFRKDRVYHSELINGKLKGDTK